MLYFTNDFLPCWKCDTWIISEYRHISYRSVGSLDTRNLNELATDSMDAMDDRVTRHISNAAYVMILSDAQWNHAGNGSSIRVNDVICTFLYEDSGTDPS